MLLGNGRVGKTQLARALLQRALRAEEPLDSRRDDRQIRIATPSRPDSAAYLGLRRAGHLSRHACAVPARPRDFRPRLETRRRARRAGGRLFDRPAAALLGRLCPPPRRREPRGRRRADTLRLVARGRRLPRARGGIARSVRRFPSRRLQRKDLARPRSTTRRALRSRRLRPGAGRRAENSCGLGAREGCAGGDAGARSSATRKRSSPSRAVDKGFRSALPRRGRQERAEASAQLSASQRRRVLSPEN